MAVDVAVHEGAERQHRELAPADVVERLGDERRAEAVALEARRRSPCGRTRSAPGAGGRPRSRRARRRRRPRSGPARGCPRPARPSRKILGKRCEPSGSAGRSATTTRDVDRARPALDPRRGHAAADRRRSWTRIPYPILLVFGGLGLAVTPGIPEVELDPELVLLIILPPLLYAAAFFTPLRELRRNVARDLDARDRPRAGDDGRASPSSPTRPSASAGPRRSCSARSSPPPTRSPRPRSRAGSASRDGSSRSSRARAWSTTRPRWSPTSSRSPPSSPAASACSTRAASSSLTVARRDRRRDRSRRVIAAMRRRRLDNPPVEVTIALFSGYFAYLPAEAIGVSGVLAAVTVGIYMGRLTSRLTTPTTRIQGDAVWEIVTVPAQLGAVRARRPAAADRDRRDLRASTAGELVRDGAADRRDRDRDPDRLGLPVHLSAAAAARPRCASASPTRPGATRCSSPGPGCAARSRSPPRSPCR